MSSDKASATRESVPSTSQSNEPNLANSSSAETGGVSSVVGNSAFEKALPKDEYLINVGTGIRILSEDFNSKKNNIRIPLIDKKYQVLSGFKFSKLLYSKAKKTAKIIGFIDVPHIKSPKRGVEIIIGANGKASLKAELKSDLPVFKNKRLDISLDEKQNLTSTLIIDSTDLTPKNKTKNFKIEGGGIISLGDGKLDGKIKAEFEYANLGKGKFDFTFDDGGRASGGGNFNFEGNFLKGASVELAIDDKGSLSANVEAVPLADINTGIPNLSITDGKVGFAMKNSAISGGLNNLTLVYNGFGKAVLNAKLKNGQFTGKGIFALTLADLADVSGTLKFKKGILTGSVTITSNNFPSALNVESGKIIGNFLSSGDIEFTGEALIDLGPAGTGILRAIKENGIITIGANITLENIPGLQSAEIFINYTSEGKMTGTGDVAIDETLIPGLSGTVQISFIDNLWSGESEIGYTREDPLINGNVLIKVRQTEEGVLVLSGSGDLSAEIIPGVEGTAGLLIDEEGNVVLNFAIIQTNPYELFPEKRFEREFLNIKQSIPLFAGILVAVLRIRAGARAGVGPGQIRNSKIEGIWELTDDKPPDMKVSTEFFMPAFVEGYVAFGAGLGVDVLLGSLTGGIEAIATAGIYGAISVVPELSYENGDWMFEGTATIAAGSRLKINLNAWAEIEAAWVTVWDRTWELASHTMNIGPDLALSANVLMNLSNPSAPEISFDSSDVDTQGLINSALPKDGPPGAGTKEAVKNQAQWKGRSKAPGSNADKVPADLANQAKKTEKPPAVPAKPAPKKGPPPGNKKNTSGKGDKSSKVNRDNGASKSDKVSAPAGASKTTKPSDKNRKDGNASSKNPNGSKKSTGPDSKVPDSKKPRYPKAISLATLDEGKAVTPRTVAQEKEDLRAAVKVFGLVEKKVENSEQLASYFPSIQKRFQLTSIGYESAGNKIKVRIAINPITDVQPAELVKGRGITGKKTEIRYTPAKLKGSSSVVGIKMVADPLGPDYKVGTPPSGQGDLMGRLTTSGASANQKFVRGHLLNDLVGGEGRPRNLFPITAAANQVHEQRIERRVKSWVNVNRYWVYYEVEIDVGAVDIRNPARKATNKVNSTIKCKAAVYDLSGNKQNQITANIASTFNTPSGVRVTNASGPDEASEVPVIARQEDLDTDVELSTRVNRDEYKLPSDIYTELERVYALGEEKKKDIRPALKNRIVGMGDSRVSTLRFVFENTASVLEDLTAVLSRVQKSDITRIKALAGEIIAALGSIR